MDTTTTSQWQFMEGDEVFGSDGDKIGEIAAADETYIVVKKGWLFPSDHYIPRSAISTYEDGNIYLAVTKDQALNQEWGQNMGTSLTDDVRDSVPTPTIGSADSYQVNQVVGEDELTGTYNETSAPPIGSTIDSGSTMGAATTTGGAFSTETTGTTGTTSTAGSMGRRTLEAGDHVAVPVHEEELVVGKREREAGEVEITKEVVTEMRTVEVPVTEERVRVEWRAASGEGVDPNAFEGGTIEIPISTEEIVVGKQTKVVGELEITKDAVQRTEQVTDSVRREEVHVEDPQKLMSDDVTTRTRTTSSGDSTL